GSVSSCTNCTFTSNHAGGSGGAIYVDVSGTVPPTTFTVTNGLFTLNKASGASSTQGGGAIFASATGSGPVSIINSTFASNEVDGNDGRGDAIFNAKSDTLAMVVDHNVFTLNKLSANAAQVGGAIFSSDNMVVRACSFISNDAGLGNGGAI